MGFAPCSYLNIFLTKLKIAPFCMVSFDVGGRVCVFAPVFTPSSQENCGGGFERLHTGASSHALAPSSRALAPFTETTEKRDGKIKGKHLNVKARVSLKIEEPTDETPPHAHRLPSAIFDEAPN